MLVWKNKSPRKLRNSVTALSKPRLCWGNNAACEHRWRIFLTNPSGKAVRSAPRQQESALEGKLSSIHLQPCGGCWGMQSRYSLPSLQGAAPGRTGEVFCTGSWKSAALWCCCGNYYGKVSARFKGIICKKVTIFLLILSFFLLRQRRRKNILLFSSVCVLLPASLTVLSLTFPSVSEAIRFPSAACPLEEPS